MKSRTELEKHQSSNFGCVIKAKRASFHISSQESCAQASFFSSPPLYNLSTVSLIADYSDICVRGYL